jgi:DNA-binding beta-propeller fold protein YncE
MKRTMILGTAIFWIVSLANGADWLIVLNKSDGTTSIPDAKTGVARATVPVGKTPHEAEVLADGRLVAVSNCGTREEAGCTITFVDLAPDGKRAWVASTNADVVSAIDLDGLVVVGRLTAGKEPDGLAGLFAR